MPEITLTGPDSATGIWAMYDRVEMPGNRFEGYGHYHDEYRRVDGAVAHRRHHADAPAHRTARGMIRRERAVAGTVTAQGAARELE